MRYLINTLVVITIYLYFLKPSMRRKPVKHFLGVKFAHRGLHNYLTPENTLSSFSRAVNDGFGIELDIHLTKDGEIVVFHDYDLLRACNVNKKISDLTYTQIKQYMIFDSDNSIPTFKEVLKLVSGKVPLLIEIKASNKILGFRICRAVVKLLDNYNGSYCIESFNPLYLFWFRHNRPDITRGQLMCKFPYRHKKRYFLFIFLLRSMLLNVLARPDFLAYDYKHKYLLSVRLCRLIFRTPMFAWTVPDELLESDALRKYNSFIFEEE
ncbi:MAG: hypothetical protein A2Y17_12870 [Clostridiales bacterium GWF2_38_85]|nr:MAG: hypothetical protein A2Y17_12870 [Clostridiales bacterium GWF2_38_85]